jgi:hypothetical protein
LPNGETTDSIHTVSLDIPELSETTSVEHVFPDMTNRYLLSVGQMCNEGYYVTFRIYGVTIYNSRGKAVLKGKRDLSTGLWRINLRYDKPQPTIAAANNVYELCNTGALVNYLHKAMFIPTKSTLLQAIKKGHTPSPGLTEAAINKHLNPSFKHCTMKHMRCWKHISQKMMWSISLFHLIVTDTKPRSKLFELSKIFFPAGLSSADPDFLLHLWDHLLPQSEITTNLMRISRQPPQSSAVHFRGMIDYNKLAFAQPGCKIIAHEKSSQRRTWAPHGQHGYSLGPVMHHYRRQHV